MSATAVSYRAFGRSVRRVFATEERARQWASQIGKPEAQYEPVRYVQDVSAGAREVRVPCLKCDKMVQLSEATIDTEGPAFLAYYHRECLNEQPEILTE